METSSIQAAAAPVSPGARRQGHLSRARLGWRLGFLLTLVLLLPAWVRSWDHIDAWQFFFGPSGHLELCHAGSSVGVMVSIPGDPVIDFSGPTGPVAEGLLPYDVQWADGSPLGTATNSCLFPPYYSEVSDCRLDRVGSLGASLHWPESAHVHLPYWAIALGVLGIWLGFERRYFRRSALKSPSTPRNMGE